MYLFGLILWIPLFSITYASNNTCHGTYSYDGTNKTKGESRVTSISVGNYTIQALLDISENICNKISRYGLIQTYALKYAIHNFNNNKTFSNIATLGLQIDDVCKDVPTTILRTFEAVSLYREEKSACLNSFLCNANSKWDTQRRVKEITAMIGGTYSYTTIPLARFISTYKIPLVSHSASSRQLNNRSSFKTFFRTVSTDEGEASIIVDVIQRLNWTYVFAVGSNDKYGRFGIENIVNKSISKNIKISNVEYIPSYLDDPDKRDYIIERVIDEIEREHRATVVILYCYPNIGHLLLQKAAQRNLTRIWLTSGAWTPTAKDFLKKSDSLKRLSRGILSVSRNTTQSAHFVNYIREDIKANFKCNIWLQQYMANEHNCVPVELKNNETLHGEDGCSVTISTIMNKLKYDVGYSQGLIDATESLGYSIYNVLKGEINKGGERHVESLNRSKIIEEMRKISYINKQGNRVSYNLNNGGTHYTLENMVWDSTLDDFQYKRAATWIYKKENLQTRTWNEKIIEWPLWFNYTYTSRVNNHTIYVPIPRSDCSDPCPAGYYIKSTNGTCWECERCTGNTITRSPMQEKCQTCSKHSQADDRNQRCLDIPIVWMDHNTSLGLLIACLTIGGLSVIIISIFILYRFQRFLLPNEKSPNTKFFWCFLITVTLSYGVLYIMKPSVVLCRVQSGIFFALYSVYCCTALVSTKSFLYLLTILAEEHFHKRLFRTQIYFITLMLLIETLSIGAWFFSDYEHVLEIITYTTNETTPRILYIEQQCSIEFGVGRIVSLIIPSTLLAFGTVLSIRDRLSKHMFHEPLFIVAACTLLCVIIASILPMHKLSSVTNRSSVVGLTIISYAYTLLLCFILPKLYLAVIRRTYGIQKYPLRINSRRKRNKKSKNRKNKRTMVRQTSIPVYLNQKRQSVNMISNFEFSNKGNVHVNVEAVKKSDYDFGFEKKPINYHLDPLQNNRARGGSFPNIFPTHAQHTNKTKIVDNHKKLQSSLTHCVGGRVKRSSKYDFHDMIYEARLEFYQQRLRGITLSSIHDDNEDILENSYPDKITKKLKIKMSYSGGTKKRDNNTTMCYYEKSPTRSDKGKKPILDQGKKKELDQEKKKELDQGRLIVPKYNTDRVRGASYPNIHHQIHENIILSKSDPAKKNVLKTKSGLFEYVKSKVKLTKSGKKINQINKENDQSKVNNGYRERCATFPSIQRERNLVISNRHCQTDPIKKKTILNQTKKVRKKDVQSKNTSNVHGKFNHRVNNRVRGTTLPDIQREHGHIISSVLRKANIFRTKSHDHKHTRITTKADSAICNRVNNRVRGTTLPDVQREHGHIISSVLCKANIFRTKSHDHKHTKTTTKADSAVCNSVNSRVRGTTLPDVQREHGHIISSVLRKTSIFRTKSHDHKHTKITTNADSVVDQQKYKMMMTTVNLPLCGECV